MTTALTRVLSQLPDSRVRGRPGGRVSSRSLRARRRVLRSSPPYAVIALGSVCFLALALYVTRALHPSQSEKSRPVEFLSLASGRVDCGAQSMPFAEIEEEGDGAASVSEETIVRPRYGG